MAKLKMYSTYDSKAQAWLTPFFFRSRGECLRSFEQTINDPKSMLCLYPNDFCLYEIGEFDEETGSVTIKEPKDSLGLAVQYKRSPQVQEDLLSPVPIGASAQKVTR